MIHAGILADKNKINHKKQLKNLNLNSNRFSCCKFYPFESTVKKSSKQSDCIENIDIGGPSLIRGAAKNYKSVTVITSINQYNELIKEAKRMRILLA